MRHSLFILLVLISYNSFAQKPVIDSIRPRSAAPGSTVTIYGTNFSGVVAQNAIYTNSVKWRVQSSTSTSITALVPFGAVSGIMSVTNTSTVLTGISKEPFKVIISGNDNIFKSGSISKLKRIDSLPLASEPEMYDIDGDGKQDLVQNSTGFNQDYKYKVSIFRNLSTNSELKFGPRQNIILAGFSFKMNVADYDGDGKLDVLSCTETVPKLSIYRNLSTDTGVINFSGSIDISVSPTINTIMFSDDLNLDGKIDIIRSGSGGDTLYVLRNTSATTMLNFSPEIKILTRKSAFKLIDFDGDGKKDIISIESGVIYFQRNTSTTSSISFSTPMQYNFPQMNLSYDFLVNDFDGDGKTDFAVQSGDLGFVSIFLNTSNGSVTPQFAAPKNYTCIKGFARMFSYDPDGDGLPEIGLENNFLSLSNLELLKNSSTPGNINFSNSILLNPYDKVGISRFGVGDINGDGKEDFIFGVNGGDSFGFLENRSGKLTISSFTPKIAKNGDTVEIVGSNFSGVDKVLFGNENAKSFSIVNDTLIRAVVGLGSSGSIYVQKGGLIDSAFSFKYGSLSLTQVEKLLLKPGKDQLNLSNTVFGNDERRTYKISFGDQTVNADLINKNFATVSVPYCPGGESSTISLSYGGLTTILNKLINPIFDGGDTTFRNGMFDSLRAAAMIGNSGKLKVGSFSGGIGNDCYVLNTQNNGGTFFQAFGPVLPGYSGSPFTPFNFEVFRNRKIDDFIKADFDQDGLQDYALLSISDGKIHMYKNYRVINLDNDQPIYTFTLPPNTKQLLKGDLNDDGKIDLVVTTTDNSVDVYLNRSTPFNIQFAPVRKINFSGSIGDRFQLFDINGDNRADFVGSYGGQQITVITDTSADKTLKYANMPVATASVNVTASPIIADFNGDTMPDLAFRSESLKKLLVFTYTGNSISPFSYKQSNEIDVTTDQIKNIQFHDFDGNGYPDLLAESGKTNDTTSVISLFRNSSKSSQTLSFAPPYEIRNIVGITDIKAADLNYDARPDIVIARSRKSGINTVNELVYMLNKITDTSLVGGKPVIRFVTPTSISGKDTIRVIGSSFSRVGSVTFGGVPATYFSVINDTIIRAVAGNGKSGFLTVRSLAGADSIGNITVANVAAITSFTPVFGYIGDTIRIVGSNLDSTKQVRFGNSNAKSFRVISDSVVLAVLDSGATGDVIIDGTKGRTTLGGFTYGAPVLFMTDSLGNPIQSIVFTSISPSPTKIQRFILNVSRVKNPIQLESFGNTQISFGTIGTFTTKLILTTIRGQIPFPINQILVNYNGPIPGSDKQDSIIISSPGITTLKIPVVYSVCDTVNKFIPRIADVNTVCYKDSIRIGIINSTTRYSSYQWSTGDTSQTILLRNNNIVRLRVALKPGCFSDSSAAVNFLNHVNTIPVLSISRDSVLSTQTAPQYRWYRNNRILNGVNSNTYTAQNIGLYKVETSSNGVCWDGSNEIPIFTLPNRSNNDTLLLRVYPNPSSGDFTVQASLQNPTNVTARILITDMGGTTIIQNTRFIFFGREIRIPVTIVNKGTYVVRMEMNGQIKTVNVIVQ